MKKLFLFLSIFSLVSCAAISAKPITINGTDYQECHKKQYVGTQVIYNNKCVLVRNAKQYIRYAGETVTIADTDLQQCGPTHVWYKNKCTGDSQVEIWLRRAQWAAITTLEIGGTTYPTCGSWANKAVIDNGACVSTDEMKRRLKQIKRTAKREQKQREREARQLLAKNQSDAAKKAEDAKYLNAVSEFELAIKDKGYDSFTHVGVRDVLQWLLTHPNDYDKYPNKIVFGCTDNVFLNRHCRGNYSHKIKVQQVTPDHVMYSGYFNGETLSFLLKKDDKPYMAGQVFRTDAYVVTGTHTYATAIGSTNTLFVIKRIN